ncbi:MAG TPA: hypothetical protein V6C85_03595 [Allocoleopsis sp.]
MASWNRVSFVKKRKPRLRGASVSSLHPTRRMGAVGWDCGNDEGAQTKGLLQGRGGNCDETAMKLRLSCIQPREKTATAMTLKH